jgi:hypothetical protein
MGGPQLTEEQARHIFAAFERDGISRDSVIELANKLQKSRKQIRAYRKAMQLIQENSITGYLKDRDWGELVAGWYRMDVTQQMVGRLATWYERWKASKFTEEQVADMPPTSLHVEALLKARDRLAEQAVAILDPEEQLLDDEQKTDLDFSDAVDSQDGWLSSWQLPPGGTRNEPAFKWLYEHTRNDQHWNSLEQAASSDGTATSEWWSEYHLYRSSLQSVMREALQASRDAIDEACLAAGNSSAPVVFPAFAATALRDALRVHLGQTPLILPNYEIPSTSNPEGRTSFTMYCMGEKLAAGVADEVEMQSRITASVMRIYESLREQLVISPDVRNITERWHRLVMRAGEFATWLRSLSAEDFERTTCLLCK